MMTEMETDDDVILVINDREEELVNQADKASNYAGIFRIFSCRLIS